MSSTQTIPIGDHPAVSDPTVKIILTTPAQNQSAGIPCHKCGTPAVWRTRKDSRYWYAACPDWKCGGKIAHEQVGSIVRPDAPPEKPVVQAPAPLAVVTPATATHPQHEAVALVLRRVQAGLSNILLVGPSGSGKTHLCHDVADALGVPFAALSCSGGMPEWHLTGRSFPSLTTGANVYQESDFVRFYETGGVFLLDEMDAADANVMIVVNSALANGHMSIPSRTSNPVATRHPKFVLVGAANTYGNGANRQYVGRNQLDAATLSRFACATISVDYSRTLEAQIVPEKPYRETVWYIRERVAELSMRRIVGTRELLAYSKLRRAGFTQIEAVNALTEGWTADEISRVSGYALEDKATPAKDEAKSETEETKEENVPRGRYTERFMKNKFRAICRVCQQVIAPGDDIAWLASESKGRKVRHERCYA